MPHFALPVPRQWTKHIKSAFIQTISLASVTFTSTYALASKRKATVTRLKAELAQAYHEIALLQEEMKIKDERFQHVYHLDLTTVPTSAGFWASWWPFTLLQAWPFCWWVAVVIDHFSRKVMGFAIFKRKPTSQEVRSFLDRVFSRSGKTPRHLIIDKDGIFFYSVFKRWCKRMKIRPRFGAVGKNGSIAIIERFFRSMKSEGTRRILVPFRMDALRQEIVCYIGWYNQHRPHSGLQGRTPDEVYKGKLPANQQPRFEPRHRWPRGSPCASPQTKIKGKTGVKMELVIGHYKGRKHLPVIELKRVA
ncbi:MAG: DDE-type integrase/transposase/recombinase [Planctomycetes bacterium]|nr:DDE-type integrase/transposase/recombinase [Planctomycetota bacterium]